MTYRSDHEAALHRLDTLERELAELRATRSADTMDPPAPPARPGGFAPALVFALIGVMAALAIGASALLGRGSGDEPATAAHVDAPVPSDRAELRACAERTVTLAPCRPLLRLHDSLDLSPDERGMVAMWARTEEALALTIDALKRSPTVELRARFEALRAERTAVLRDLAL